MTKAHTDVMDMARAEQAVQEAAQLRQHQEQLQGQQVQLAEEQPEFMAIQSSVSSSEEDCSSVASGSDLEIWDTPMDKPMDDTSDSCEENNPQGSVGKCFQHWALKHQIPHSALDDPLVGLKANGHPELPSSARTLLSTPRGQPQYREWSISTLV